jgi:ribosomal-protein-alanine N-acetyltransferase
VSEAPAPERAAGSRPLVVRSARRSDLDDIVAIETASFATPWSRKTFGYLLERRNAVVLAAIDPEERLVGYAVLWFAGGEGELGNVAVHPEARGCGVADRLMASVFEVAVERGTEALFLEVRTGNDAARALYRKHGFDVVGRRPDYYSKPVEDALIMRRLFAR